MVNFNPPPTPPGQLSNYLTSLVETLKRALLPLISKDEAIDRIILLSPSGKSFNVRVDDSGNLTTEVNDGKSRL
ncbi:hypothetical protein [Rhizobium favelukesii]|uniref:hypothetical protein n=1 Tax=Rhizobium favelukesii TaxID=348824 RepID=UPI00056D1383|nr:hypothetical protein [Rhizobium favelukesii]MCS0459329.1 hypothetical protein [Rhizobium favelukesii]